MTNDYKPVQTAVNSWRDWWHKKPQPTPTPAPAVDTPSTNGIPWLRVGLILRSIPFKELKPVFFTIPALLFLAISGLIAWIVVVLRFAISIFEAL